MPLVPEFLKPTLPPDYNVKIFGPALRFIEPDDPLRAIVLYKIYKNGSIDIQELKEMMEGIDIESILSWLQEKGFVTIDDDVVQYEQGFEEWFKSSIPSIEGDQIIRAIVDYYFSKGYCVVPVKQIPGIERPDLIAIPITSEFYFNCHKAIPIEVELSLDKGQKSLEQAYRNMIKNPEFPEKHIITLIKFRNKIMEIYNNLDDNVKKKVKILFYDGNRILESKEVEFVEIVEKTAEENKEAESKREEEKQKRKIKDTQTRSLLEFVKDERDEGMVKTETEEEIKVEEPTEEPATKTVEEKSHEDVKDRETEEEGLMISWNNKTYILEKDKDSERVARFVNEFLEEKRENIRIVEKDGMLKVLDEKGNVIAKAKILKTI